jgi:hypothetical protein
LPPPLVTDDDDNEAMLPATKQDKDKAVQVRQDMQEEHSFHFEDDDMDYDYDKMIDQDMNDIEVQPVSIEKEMQLDVMEKGIRPDDDIEKAMQPDDVEKAIQPEPEESPMTAMEKQSSVEVETIDESPPELDTDEATEAAEEKVQEQLEVDFHFEDDGMDYGYDEEIQQESTGSTPEETQRLETTVEKPSFEIEEQIKQDPTSEALRTVKYAMRNQRSRIKSKKNLANAHIVAIRKVSLDVMKEMK